MSLQRLLFILRAFNVQRFQVLMNSKPSSQRVYLDYNATTPLFPSFHSKLKEWAKFWGNPSSIHWAGRESKSLLRRVRSQSAQFIGAHPDEIIFTSGGSESNNLALKGFFLPLINSKAPKPLRLLVSSVEHPSVLNTALELKKSHKVELDLIPIKKNGIIDIEAYKEKLKKKPLLVSVMLANNETGNLFPIKDMTSYAHESGALFHTDAVQALGKRPLNVQNLNVDLASFSGHKFYALKGVGFLYIKRGVKIQGLIDGGKQERGYRAGTENLLALASMEAILSLSNQSNQIEKKANLIQNMRDEFEDQVLKNIDAVSIVGKEGKRLPNTSLIIFQGVNGESLLMNLDLDGFALSSGAACSSGTSQPSSVLLAMGFKPEEANSSLRISLGWDTKKKDLERFLNHLILTVKRLRSI